MWRVNRGCGGGSSGNGFRSACPHTNRARLNSNVIISLSTVINYIWHVVERLLSRLLSVRRRLRRCDKRREPRQCHIPPSPHPTQNGYAICCIRKLLANLSLYSHLCGSGVVAIWLQTAHSLSHCHVYNYTNSQFSSVRACRVLLDWHTHNNNNKKNHTHEI